MVCASHCSFKILQTLPPWRPLSGSGLRVTCGTHQGCPAVPGIFCALLPMVRALGCGGGLLQWVVGEGGGGGRDALERGDPPHPGRPVYAQPLSLTLSLTANTSFNGICNRQQPPSTALATSSVCLPNRSWGRLCGPFPSLGGGGGYPRRRNERIGGQCPNWHMGSGYFGSGHGWRRDTLDLLGVHPVQDSAVPPGL